MASMAELGLTFLFFLATNCLILAEWNTQDYMKKEHSLIKPYHEGRWDFLGSTMVTNNYVRLTSDHQSRQGSIWNNQPCMLRDWELHVHFKVHGQGTDLYGDGMAIWYAKDRMQGGPVFGSKDLFYGISIFMDTYSNHNGPHNHGHPYVSAMINNGTLSYDHDRDGTHTELAGCESHFRNKQHDTYLAIRYERDTLTVSMDVENKKGWTQCFEVTGVRLPTGYHFGASASTGQLADNHDIISMKLYDIGIVYEDDKDEIDYRKVIPSADFFASPRGTGDEEPKLFLLGSMDNLMTLSVAFLLLVSLAVSAVAIYILYIKYEEDNKKRLI